MPYWFREEASTGHNLEWKIRKTLYSGQSKYQKIEIVETEDFGTALILDGIMQTTSGDDYIYHEMMGLVPLAAHPSPKNVLIIGGGDCGLASTVLQDKRVKQVTLVEIDEKVVELSQLYLPNHARNLEHTRFQIIYQDGAQFLRDSKRGQFDLILVDSTDPETTYGQLLYTSEFYRSALRALKATGIYVQQSGNPFYNPEVVGQTSSDIASVFPRCQIYLSTVPTYPGGLFTFTAGTTGIDISTVRHQITGQNQWYTPELHKASFVLPKQIKKMVEQSVSTNSSASSQA